MRLLAVLALLLALPRSALGQADMRTEGVLTARQIVRDVWTTEDGRLEARLDGRDLPSGTYLVRLTTDGGFAATQRLTLLQ